MHPLEPVMDFVSRTAESRFLNQLRKKSNVYTRSEEYYNFFKLTSPFSPSIKVLYILSRGTVSFGFQPVEN